MKYMWLLIISLVLEAGLMWHFRQECYNGDLHFFPFTGPEDMLQTGVSPEGYPISCDGKVHPEYDCALLYSGVCFYNASQVTP